MDEVQSRKTMSITKRRLFGLIAVFMIGFVFQVGIQRIMFPYAINGYLFQMWSSEDLMQTVSIEDLRHVPVKSLINIHIQPPGFDALRAILVQFFPSSDIFSTLRQVDLSIYFLWSIMYGLTGSIIFIWLEELTNTGLSLISTLAFLFHPALIFYATLLDTTLLSSTLMLWLYYLLWKTRENSVPLISLISATILLFFFRSIFQFPFILLMGFVLFMQKVPARNLAMFLITTVTVCGVYIAKQQFQFDMVSTSSLTGINLVRSVGITDYQYPYEIDLQDPTSGSMPDVLTRTRKITGTINYNNLQYLYLNTRLINEYKNHIFKSDAQVLVDTYRENIKIYFAPSSQYTAHVIADRLAWRSVYDQVFSEPLLPFLLIVASAISIIKMLRERNYYRFLALLLPGLYVFALSILFEKGENNRFKFFLEPVFYVYFISQYYVLYQWLRSRYFKKTIKSPESIA